MVKKRLLKRNRIEILFEKNSSFILLLLTARIQPPSLGNLETKLRRIARWTLKIRQGIWCVSGYRMNQKLRGGWGWGLGGQAHNLLC